MKFLLVSVLAVSLGLFLQQQFNVLSLLGDGYAASSPEAPKASDSSEQKPLYWVAPMDKNYRRDEPGKSPMGMDLVPVYEEETTEGGVKISPIVVNNLGVKVARVEQSALSHPISTVGIVEYDESRILHLHTRAEGWIEKLYVSSGGDPVKKGQTLFELYSPVLINAQREYLLELKRGNAQLIRSSKSKLLSLGLTNEHVKHIDKKRRVMDRVSFKAEFDGVVKMLNVRQGMHVQPSTEVLSIVSLDSVWVRADIFERQAYQIYQGQNTLVSLNAFPDKSWSGMVNYVYPELDPKTRTLQTRIRVHNPEHILKPNMIANLEIETADYEPKIHVPRSAVIKGKYVNRVVKVVREGQFQTVPVEIGAEGFSGTEKRLIVTKGLNSGDEVVVSAQFLIDSESNIDTDLLRMTLEEDASKSGDSALNKNKVITRGKLHRLQNAMGMVKLTHDAIPEWDWPVMTMEFQVKEGLDLNNVTLESEVMLEIEKRGDWDFVITRVGEKLESINPNMSEMNHSEMNHSEMTHSEMTHSEMRHEEMNHSHDDQLMEGHHMEGHH